MSMDVVSGVVRRENEEGDWEYLLLEKRSGTGTPYLDYVGGTVEEDEGPLEAFKREFREETGSWLSEVLEELKCFNEVKVEWYEEDYEINPYDVRVSEGLEPELSDEHEGYRWLSRAEIDEQYRKGILSEGRMKTLEQVESTSSRYQELEAIRYPENLRSRIAPEN